MHSCNIFALCDPNILTSKSKCMGILVPTCGSLLTVPVIKHFLMCANIMEVFKKVTIQDVGIL